MYVVPFEIFSVKEWCDLETGSRGRSKSLKMAPFDRSYMTFYWSDSVGDFFIPPCIQCLIMGVPVGILPV